MAREKARLYQAAAQAVMGVWVEGCPHLFVSRVPVGPDGVAWTAPTDAHGNDFTVTAALDVAGGLSSSREQWDPKAGTSVGSGLTVRLVRSSALDTLFATKPASAPEAVLAATVGHNTTGTSESRYEVQVGSTDGFDASGFIWVGRECIGYPSKTATAFGDESAPDQCERGCFNWGATSYLDQRHEVVSNGIGIPVKVFQHIPTWRGRRVIVFQWSADERGRCLDTAYRGNNEWQVWSGWVDSVAYGGADYTHIELSCRGLLQELLDREVGYQGAKGFLGGTVTGRVWMTPATSRINILKVRYADDASESFGELGPLTVTDAAGELFDGWCEAREVWTRIGATVQAAIEAWLTDDLSLSHDLEVRETGRLISSDQWGEPIPGLPADTVCNLYLPELTMALNSLDGTNPVLNIQTSPLGELGAAAHCNMLQMLGTTPGTVSTMTAGETPVLVLVQASQHATTLSCCYDPSETRTWPTSGFARITDGDASEIIYYEGLTDAGQYFTLTGVWRGLAGTERRYYIAGGVGDQDAPTVTACWGWLRRSVAELLLEALVSTGQGGHGSYDDLGREVGLALDPTAVHVESFIALADEPYSLRTVVFDRPVKLRELVEKNMVFHGFVLGACTDPDTGLYQLTPLPLSPPALHATGTALTLASGVLLEPRPRLRTSVDLITRVQARLRYDAGKGEFQGDPIEVNYFSGMTATGDRRTLSVEVAGLDEADAVSAALYASERLFFLFGQEQHLCVLSADRRGLLLSPGQAVSLTIAGIPTPYGSSGLTAATGIISSVTKRWLQPGTQAAAELEVWLLPEVAGIAPTFSLTDYDAGTPSVTVSPNDWTLPGDPRVAGYWEPDGECRDYHHGPRASGSGAGFRVWVFNYGDYAAGEERTVYHQAGDDDDVWRLDSALTLTPGADLRAEFMEWGTTGRSATQDLYAHIADENEELGPDDDPAFEWTV